jgi:hypothetical protein
VAGAVGQQRDAADGEGVAVGQAAHRDVAADVEVRPQEPVVRAGDGVVALGRRPDEEPLARPLHVVAPVDGGGETAVDEPALTTDTGDGHAPVERFDGRNPRLFAGEDARVDVAEGRAQFEPRPHADSSPAADVRGLSLIAGVCADLGLRAQAEEVLHRKALVLHPEAEGHAAVSDRLR